MSSATVRSALVTAIEADLVGPFYPDAAAGPQDELLTLPPSRWYLTGFLAPQSDRETKDPTADEEFSGAEEDEDEDNAAAEPEPKQKNHFPASMGLSVFLPRPPTNSADMIRATVTFADYLREEQPAGDGKKRRVGWRRVPRPPRSVDLELTARTIEKGEPVPGTDTPGILVCGKLEPADAPGLPPGTRALSLFVVNKRSLRELGGMRRLVEDDVRKRAFAIEKRLPHDHRGGHPWARDRAIGIPVELTSRLKAGTIKEAKDRLGSPFVAEDRVDVLLASNMISVGVDIDRLGLMVVAGQPKTTSEYIQASSRVGRQHPGLVVTCFNVRRPRDRSHYERFTAYHESFYRYVEATSLTPFSGPALDRGLAGTLLSMVRLGDPVMTPATAAMEIGAHHAFANACVDALARRAGRHSSNLQGEDYDRTVAALSSRGHKLIEAWEKLCHEARHEAAARRCYSPYDKDRSAGRPLLFGVTDDNAPDPNSLDARFAAPTSMRDVESQVHLWIERRSLGGKR